jgi:hypothetical protein
MLGDATATPLPLSLDTTATTLQPLETTPLPFPPQEGNYETTAPPETQAPAKETPAPVASVSLSNLTVANVVDKGAEMIRTAQEGWLGRPGSMSIAMLILCIGGLAVAAGAFFPTIAASALCLACAVLLGAAVISTKLSPPQTAPQTYVPIDTIDTTAPP